MLSRAADSDAEAAALLATLDDQRARGQAHIVQSLHRRHQLRTGLRFREAADIVHALMSPEVYRLLVIDRAWSPERFQQWATEALIQQLT